MRFSGWDLAFWVIIVAAIATFVRPGSKGAKLVVLATDAFAAVVGSVTGYSQGGSQS